MTGSIIVPYLNVDISAWTRFSSEYIFDVGGYLGANKKLLSSTKFN